MANDIFLDGTSVNMISRSDGLVLIGFFLAFLVYTFGIVKNTPEESTPDDIKILPV